MQCGAHPDREAPMQLDFGKIWVEVNWPAVALLAVALAGLAVFHAVRRRPRDDAPPELG